MGIVQLLGYAVIIAQNGGLSTGPARVMIRPRLHLTASGGWLKGGRYRKENFEIIRPVG
jgi:hypothetical protein